VLAEYAGFMLVVTGQWHDIYFYGKHVTGRHLIADAFAALGELTKGTQ